MAVGTAVGSEEGMAVSEAVGTAVGEAVGSEVGIAVGDAVDTAVGVFAATETAPRLASASEGQQSVPASHLALLGTALAKMTTAQQQTVSLIPNVKLCI